MPERKNKVVVVSDKNENSSIFSGWGMAAPVVAALASGAYGGYLSSNAKRPRETTEERRRRIMRDAGLSAAVGGGAVTAGMLGYDTLEKAHPAGLFDFTAPHAWTALGTGAVGGFSGGKMMKSLAEPNRAAARSLLARAGEGAEGSLQAYLRNGGLLSGLPAPTTTILTNLGVSTDGQIPKVRGLLDNAGYVGGPRSGPGRYTGIPRRHPVGMGRAGGSLAGVLLGLFGPKVWDSLSGGR